MSGKKIFAAALLVGAGLSGAAHANDDTLLGAVVGGALGATIGHSIGGRDAAVFGGVIGAAAGASIAESERDYRSGPYYGSGRYAEPDPYYYSAPRGRVIVDDTPRYYQPPVVYSPPVVYVRGDYRDRGYRDRDYRDHDYRHRREWRGGWEDRGWDRRGDFRRDDDSRYGGWHGGR